MADPACREGWEKNFPRLLKKVWNEHHPEVFLIAGDLALHAYQSEYKRILHYMKKIPTYWIAVPGDHDVPLKNFQKSFGSLRKVIDIGKWRFIGLNTSNRMFLHKEELWFEKNVRNNSIVFSHVPPEASGWTFHSLWPKSSDRFLKMVKRNQRKIHSMFFGHIHGFTRRKAFGVPMIVTGAVAESRRVRNNRYDGKGFFEMIVFYVKSGRTSICKLNS